MGDLQLVKKFKVNDGFFGRYEKLVKNVVLPGLMDASERTKDLVGRPGFMGKYPQEMPLFN